MAIKATTYFDFRRRHNVAHSRAVRTVWLAGALVLLPWGPMAAQVVERPIAFDSAGRVMMITPELAKRFALDPRCWPVDGDFVEARLYVTPVGASVLAVRRADGSITRHELDEPARFQLQAAIRDAVTARGNVVSEEGGGVILESTARAFVRGQKLVSAVLYAPAAATLAGEQSSGAVYALVAGGSYFALNELVERVRVTRAQADLANDAAWRGAGMAVMALAAMNVGEPKAYSAGLIGGGIAGTIAGFNRGRTFSDAEAAAAGTGSTLFGLSTFGVLAAAGAFDSSGSARASLVPVLAAMTLGWGISPAYPRRASYGVTSSDVSLVRLSTFLGAAAALTPVVGSENVDGHLAIGVATAGLIGGALIGDRAFARPVDHTRSDYRGILLAVGAGSTLFGAIPALARSDNAAVNLGAWTAGALFGAAYAETKVRARARGPRGAPEAPERAAAGAGDGRSARPRDVRFSPTGALAVAAGSRGVQRILTVTF